MKVVRWVQRISSCKMIHNLKMIEHNSTISTFTSDIYLNSLKQLLPFILQIRLRNISLPNNTLKFRFKIRPEFNILSYYCFKPAFSLARNCSGYCNTGFINLHLMWSNCDLSSIKSSCKGLNNSLVIPL